jgi:ABC-type multidrug transport system fused ATPase/permease subunit
MHLAFTGKMFSFFPWLRPLFCTTQGERQMRNKLRFDDNLRFIWCTLMNARARRLAIVALSCVLAGALLIIVSPYAVGRYIDGLTSKAVAVLLAAGTLFTATELLGLLASWLRQRVRERFFQEEFWYLPQSITALYFARPLSFLTERDAEIDGGGIESLRDKVWNVMGSFIFDIIPGYAMIAFAVAACAYASPLLGLLVLCYALIERYCAWHTNTRIQRDMVPVIDGFKRWERRLTEWWNAIAYIKYQGVETKVLGRIYDEVQESLKGDDAVWRIYFARVIVWNRLASFGFATLLYTVLGYLVLRDQVSLPSAVLVFFSCEKMRSILMDLSETQREVQTNLASVAKYRMVLTRPVPFSYREGVPFAAPAIDIRLDRVSLSVPDGERRRTILRDVSLAIAAGDHVGIVGPSGAGKSQLMGLLARSTDPDHGAVRIGGHDLRDVSTETLLRYYGVIMQKSDPFADTLLGNLSFGVSHLDAACLTDTTFAETLARASLAKAGLDVATFTQGLLTNVGYKGMRLSVGQQQRLQIAAAHFKLGLTPERPRLILADEPTSALDSLSELTVMKHLEEALPPGTTLLMVAHRLSTVAHMNRIIFVRPLPTCGEGAPQVTAHASLAELYDAEALFREMADAQGFRPQG